MSKDNKFYIPALGMDKPVPIAEVFIKEGDRVEKEAPLFALESEKAVMEIPAPFSGVLSQFVLKEGDKVKEGDLIGIIKVEELKVKEPETNETQVEPPKVKEPSKASPPESSSSSLRSIIHGSPSVRLFARELGVDLQELKGSGPKGRIRKEDVISFVKALNQGKTRAQRGPSPFIDPAQFGGVHQSPLGRIQKISGPHLTQSWQNIPHVTHFDKANITSLEQWRTQLNKKEKLTLMPFIIKALVRALQEYPLFNSLLSQDGKSLITREYYNIGVALDTPGGLLVPVLKGLDTMGIKEINSNLQDLVLKGREGRLSPLDLQGASMTISNIGGLGGEYFTPIINPPEVAILGVGRSKIEPLWDKQSQSFIPQNQLPLSLSYDHRVIDGAKGAQFASYLTKILADLRESLL